MAQENWSHTSISIYKVECSVYKYTEYYRPAKIHPLYSILSKVNSIHFLSTLCMPVQYYLLPRSSLKALVSPMFQSTFFSKKHYAESTHCYIAILSVIYFQSQIIFHCLHHLMWDIFLCKLSEIVFSALYLHCLLNNFKQSS